MWIGLMRSSPPRGAQAGTEGEGDNPGAPPAERLLSWRSCPGPAGSRPVGDAESTSHGGSIIEAEPADPRDGRRAALTDDESVLGLVLSDGSNIRGVRGHEGGLITVRCLACGQRLAPCLRRYMFSASAGSAAPSKDGDVLDPLMARESSCSETAPEPVHARGGRRWGTSRRVGTMHPPRLSSWWSGGYSVARASARAQSFTVAVDHFEESIHRRLPLLAVAVKANAEHLHRSVHLRP